MEQMTAWLRGSGIALAVLAVAGFSPTAAPRAPRVPIDPLPCPSREWTEDDASFEALPGARAYFGRYDGGLYRVEIPEGWNGDLVLFAHGFRGAGGEQGGILRVGNAPIREHLVQRGFAWAASSYRCNGYVPGQGLEDTRALVPLLTGFAGRAPSRVYLTGTSMGGHVTLLGMHEYPTEFAGGLAMCPAGPGLFDFYAAVGAAAEVITGVQFTQQGLQRQTASMADMLGRPPDYTERGRQLASVQIEISGGMRPFAMGGSSRVSSPTSAAARSRTARLRRTRRSTREASCTASSRASASTRPRSTSEPAARRATRPWGGRAGRTRSCARSTAASSGRS